MLPSERAASTPRSSAERGGSAHPAPRSIGDRYAQHTQHLQAARIYEVDDAGEEKEAVSRQLRCPTRSNTPSRRPTPTKRNGEICLTSQL